DVSPVVRGAELLTWRWPAVGGPFDKTVVVGSHGTTQKASKRLGSRSGRSRPLSARVEGRSHACEAHGRGSFGPHLRLPKALGAPRARDRGRSQEARLAAGHQPVRQRVAAGEAQEAVALRERRSPYPSSQTKNPPALRPGGFALRAWR